MSESELTIDGVTLVRGRPIMLCASVGNRSTTEGVFGRVTRVDGGHVHMVTPGGSALSAGLVWMATLDSAGVERLQMFEGMDEDPYRGVLSVEEMSVPATGPAPLAVRRARARVWTVEELRRVHPLPGAWEWRHDAGCIVAEHVHGYVVRRVWVEDPGLLGRSELRAEDSYRNPFNPLDDVALPVLLANKGLDSLAEMANSLERLSETTTHEAATGAYRAAAAMLRRGTVKP